MVESHSHPWPAAWAPALCFSSCRRSSPNLHTAPASWIPERPGHASFCGYCRALCSPCPGSLPPEPQWLPSGRSCGNRGLRRDGRLPSSIISGIGVNILPNCRTSRTAGKLPATLPNVGFLAIPVIRRAGSPVIPVCIDILSPGRLLASLLRTTVGVDILPRLLQTAVCRVCLKFSVFWLRLPRLLRTLGRYILPGRLLRALGLLLYRKPVAGPFSLLVREGTDQRTAHLLGADRSVSRPSGAVAARSRPPVSRTGIPAFPLRAAGSGLPAVLGIKHRGNIRFLPGTLTPVSGSGTFLLPLSVRCGGSLLFRLRR